MDNFENAKKFDFNEFPGYQQAYVSSSVDIGKLRPNKSYDFLFENRDYFLEQILLENDGQIPEALLESIPCSLCQSNNSSFIMKKDGFSIVECENCSLVYVNPRLSSEAYEATYNSKNYGHIISQLALESHEYRKERFGVERINLINKFNQLSAKKTVLDIGSASGFFLEAASEAGWEAIGLELTESAVNFSRSRGNDVRQSTLENANFQEKSFTAVTMFDVLEHLPDPVSTLKTIHNLLEDDGLVYIYVPNWNSASRLLMGENAHFIWPTHHLTYFTPVTLTQALEKAGFQVEKIETQGLDIIDWLWQEETIKSNDTGFVKEKVDVLQFLVNSGGYGKNLRILARK